MLSSLSRSLLSALSLSRLSLSLSLSLALSRSLSLALSLSPLSLSLSVCAPQMRSQVPKFDVNRYPTLVYSLSNCIISFSQPYNV